MADNQGKTACFTGHRRITSADLPVVRQRLYVITERLIKQGVTTFLCGGAIGFDSEAGFAVLDAKARHDTVKLIMLLPCRDQDKNWSAKDKAAYKELLGNANEIIYVSEEYFDGCMKIRNMRLVEDSDYCIAYLKHTTRSGTAQTVRLASEKGIPVFNLAVDDETVTEYAVIITETLSKTV